MLSEPVTMLRRVKLFNPWTQKLDAVARLLDAWPWTRCSLTGTPNEYCEAESTGFTLKCESYVNLSASTPRRLNAKPQRHRAAWQQKAVLQHPFQPLKLAPSDLKYPCFLLLPFLC